jgi:hypothetical protein
MMTVTTTRPRLVDSPPHDADAERAALGKCLLEPSLLLSSGLEEQDFYLQKHRYIWAALLWLEADGLPVDTINLADHLEKMERLALVGGRNYLLDLTDTIPAAVPSTLLRRLRRERDALTVMNRVQAAIAQDDLAEARRALTAGLELLSGGKPATALETAWHTLGEWNALSEAPPPRQWLLERYDEETNGATRKGVLAMGKTGLLISPGGVGKTLALVQLAISVATGRPWLDHFLVPNPGRVLIALAEEDAEEIRRRAYVVARAMRLTDEQLELAATSIVAMPLAGTNVALVESTGGRTVETQTLNELRKRLGDSEWRLIILDPLSRFAGGDTEKDNAAATRFVEAAESLAQAPGSPAVLIAHHTSKPPRQGGAGPASANDARGASGLIAGVRWVANLEGSDSGAKLSVTKSNYAPKGSAVHLIRDFDHGGFLRVLTPEEQRRRSEAGDKQRAEELSALQLRIRVALEEAPGLSKDKLSEKLRVRKEHVRTAVDNLVQMGLVEGFGRYGFQLSGTWKSGRPEVVPDEQRTT